MNFSLHARPTDSHKGDFGRLLIIGGSRGMTGAPALAGMAALRSGAGLVTVAVPDSCLETVASYNPCYMTVPLPEDNAGRLETGAVEALEEFLERATCVAVGPGLSQSSGVIDVVKRLYQEFKGPMVIDADGLNAIATVPSVIDQHAGSRILTPHLGEFRRLIGRPELSVDDSPSAAVNFAGEHKVIIVLKGPGTLVTDGTVQHRNPTGNPGMATGGSGDVLTGIITALIPQTSSAFDAAALGVFVHGRAGDLARNKLGEISMTASDLVEALPAAFCSLESDASAE